MKYKKGFIFICLIICLFSIASVCASDVNEIEVVSDIQSDDLVTFEEQEVTEIIDVDRTINDNPNFEEDNNLSFNNDEKLLSSEENYMTFSENEEDILTSSQYYIGSFSGSTSVNFGSNVDVHIHIFPIDQNVPYSYNFYLEVCNSLGTSIIWQTVSGNTYNSPAELYNIKQIAYYFNTVNFNLSPGTYTARLVNNFGGTPLASYTFSVKNVFDAGQTNPSDYNYCSVNVEDTTISSSGKITMSVSCRHGYNFNLCVYDSKGNVKISKNYYNDNGGSYSLYYNIYSYTLSSGTYTIKIINAKDNKLIDSAKLIMGSGISPTDPNPDDGFTYHISFNEKNMKVIPGNDQSITMTITPNSHIIDYYFYSFYLKVFDSNNVEIISNMFSGTKSINDGTFTLHSSIPTKKLNPGEVYSVKVISGGFIMDSTTLFVYPESSNVYVDISDSIFYAGGDEVFSIGFYSEKDSYFKYDMKVKIYDSNNVLKLEKQYSGVDSNRVNYRIFNNADFDLGNYTVKVINCKNNNVIGTANLTVKSISSKIYLVDVNNTKIYCYSSSRVINMKILYKYENRVKKYKYDFYLNIYDSNNELKISKRFISTNSSNLVTYELGAKTLLPGKYTIKIINVADNYVMDTANLTVSSVSYTTYKGITFLNDCIDYNSNQTINISFDYIKRYDFFIKIYDYNNQLVLDKRYFSSSPSSDITFMVGSNLTPGIYSVKIINTHDNYLLKNVEISVKSVSYNDYSVKINPISNMDYWSNEVISISISPANNTTYKYDFYLKIAQFGKEILSQRYFNITPCNLLNFQINAKTLNPGSYRISILNSEDNHRFDFKDFEVNKIISNIYAFNITTNYNSNDYLNVDLKDSHGNAIAGVELSVKLGGNKKIVTDDNGHAKISTYGLIPQNYTATITFNGNNFYKGSTINANVFINKVKTTIVASDFIANCGEDKYLNVILKDSQGSAISDKRLILYLDELEWEWIFTDEYGQAKTSFKGFCPVNYVATITFNGDEFYEKSTTKINVKICKTKTILVPSNINIVYNSGKHFVVTLKNIKGELLSSEHVIVNLNGVKTYFTDINGKIKVSTKGLAPKVYNVMVKFKGNSYEEKSTLNIKVIIKKATPKITAKAKTFKRTVKTKNYAITLKTNQNKVMKNCIVYLNVNKKIYAAKTNSKGVAIFKITNLIKKGRYTAVITYKGNAYYNKLAKKVIISVK